MNKKRIISVLMLVIMLLSTINPVLAAPGDKGANLTWEQEINQFREYLGQSQSPLTTNEEVREFRTTYWEHLFPEYSRPPVHVVFNNESPLNYDIMYYGWQDLVEGNSKDNKGAWLYLGYTVDNRYVSNMLYSAISWRNPQLLERDRYIDGDKAGTTFHGGINPFRTDYNRPEFIGEAYLGEDASPSEKISYGLQILEQWAKNVKQRDIGWQDNKKFYDVFKYPINKSDEGLSQIERFLKYVTITVPPTSRSKGQCLAWFTSDSGRLTHRTFFIDETEEVDFIAKRYTWDEPTKTLSVFYEIKGLEKAEGNKGSALHRGMDIV